MDTKNIKKLAIIGKGTAGSISALLFSKNTPLEIDWYFDPSQPAQAVGEGSTLSFPHLLTQNLSLLYPDLENTLEGTYKNSIRKINYNGSQDYHHSFTLGSSGIHFNANKFQQLVHNYLSPHINVIPKQITDYSQIDANHIVDCSGKPHSFQDYNQVNTIPVNSAHIVQCEWEKPEFNYTLTIARPYGWVFGIPLQGRCSIGYLYNKNINTLEEVKEDIKEVFKQFNLTPSDKTKSFSFNNYYKKENFTDRVSYNGNASFFLEPLEATSIDTIIEINTNILDIFKGSSTPLESNLKYHSYIQANELMMSMHYFAGSKFSTPFWEYAYNISLKNMDILTSHPRFRSIFQSIQFLKQTNPQDLNQLPAAQFGTWPPFSFYQNIHHLGIYEKMEKLIKKNSNHNLMF